uniref:Aldolase_II domain-containing protein n=1 Tax=Meloidogyne hapla TaxID=6305 RepID=A0A1I8AW07_MELHA
MNGDLKQNKNSKNEDKNKLNDFDDNNSCDRQEKWRSPVIEEDLWDMSRRKRVKEVLGSNDFRSELEQIVCPDIARSFPEDLNSAMQCLNIQNTNYSRLPQLLALNVNQVLSNPPIKIADIGRNDNLYSLEEKQYRNKLATIYRLVDLFQWSQGIYNHITLRLPGTDPAQVLINPFGLLYNEVTASSLIKLSLSGDVIDQGSTNLGVNQAAYVLHSAIHEARPDVHCVLHLHTAVVAAGILTDDEEKKSIVSDLGDKNVMILRNHGFVACGQTVEDALHLAFHVIIACETQIRAARVGIDKLIIPSEEAVLKAYSTARSGGGGGVNRIQQNSTTISWGIGELEWEAWCRILDTAGFCTGHIYRNKLLRSTSQPSHHSMYNLSSIATPSNGPASLGTIEEGTSTTNWRLSLLFQKEKEKAIWLNSPCNYLKVQLPETGTDCPRLITRWVEQQSVSSKSGTPVKINSPLQFSPSSLDMREFNEKRRKIKEARMSGKVSPGPQSLVLDGLTLTDIEGEKPRPVYIGAASKGIVQKDQQINAQVYRKLYSTNPFKNDYFNNSLENYMKEFGEGKIIKSQSNYSEMNGTANDNMDILVNSQSVPITPIHSINKNGENRHSIKRINERSASTDVGMNGKGGELLKNGKNNGIEASFKKEVL